MLLGTPNWCQDVDVAAASPLEGYDNIMYTLHFYAATHKDDLRSKMNDALAAELPLFVSEFGVCEASGNGEVDQASADTWVELMDENNVSYLMWNLSNKDESSSVIKPDIDKTSGLTKDDLAEAGTWFAARG